MNLSNFIVEFQDHLAPRLDTYEQAIYLYVFRHSRLLGLDEITVGFKSARTRLATGVGEGGKPMSENTAYKKLASLQAKGCITSLRTNHTGRVLRLHLPSEIEGLIQAPVVKPEQDLESMDFFGVQENRALLLKREGYRCFYTLQQLDAKNFIVEHVISRPAGNNSYRNCVAASREANNRKGAMSAEDFVRQLFREGFLSEVEFQDRLHALVRLKAGELRPSLVEG
jgi:5-methylcytosine-specific restriction endonuclease McrA